MPPSILILRTPRTVSYTLYNSYMTTPRPVTPKITILTGSLTLLLVACVALAKIQPALEDIIAINTPPMGTVAGVSVGGIIEPTPTNTLYAELQTQEKELAQKRQALDAEQRYLERNTGTHNLVLYIIIGLLALLVLINFYFDIKRSRRPINQQEVHA